MPLLLPQTCLLLSTHAIHMLIPAEPRSGAAARWPEPEKGRTSVWRVQGELWEEGRFSNTPPLLPISISHDQGVHEGDFVNGDLLWGILYDF